MEGKKTSTLPAALTGKSNEMGIFTLTSTYIQQSVPHTHRITFVLGGSKSHIPYFPQSPPPSIITHIDIYITALYKVSQLVMFLRKCLSGQQGLNLLGRPGHQVLGVFVAVSRAGQRRVDLPVGPAHQLCGLAEDVLPAQTHDTFQTAIQMDFSFC